jgi:biotin transport system substrate-specific component
MAVLTFAAGQLIVFGIGVPWLKVAADMTWERAIHDGFVLFIAGGIMKAVAAGVLTPSAWRAVRRFERAD